MIENVNRLKNVQSGFVKRCFHSHVAVATPGGKMDDTLIPKSAQRNEDLINSASSAEVLERLAAVQNGGLEMHVVCANTHTQRAHARARIRLTTSI